MASSAASAASAASAPRFPPLRAHGVRSSSGSSRSGSSNRTTATRHLVRIAGAACYASRQDVMHFLQEHLCDGHEHDDDADDDARLFRVQCDVLHNHAIWMYEARCEAQALHVARSISGKLMGLKLIRASAVDRNLVRSLQSAGAGDEGRRLTLRRRLVAIAPSGEERGRALLATNLPSVLAPRALWSAFAPFQVLHVRLLRQSTAAVIVLVSAAEAQRALRERANYWLLGTQRISLKMHE